MASRHEPPSRSPSPRSLDTHADSTRHFRDADGAAAPPHKRVRSAADKEAAKANQQATGVDPASNPPRGRKLDESPTSLPPILTKEERDIQGRGPHGWRPPSGRHDGSDPQGGTGNGASAPGPGYESASANISSSSVGLPSAPAHIPGPGFALPSSLGGPYPDKPLSLTDQASFSRLQYPSNEAVEPGGPSFTVASDPSHPMLSPQGQRSAGAYRGHGPSLAQPASAPATTSSFASSATSGLQNTQLTEAASGEVRPPPPPSSTTWTAQPETSQNRRRGKLPQAVTNILKTWLMAHTGHPYPTEEEKKMLCEQTMLTMNQVSNWFINARRRILVPPSGGSSVHEVRQPARRQAQSQLARAAAQAGVSPPGLNLPPQPSPASVAFPSGSSSFGNAAGSFDFRFAPQQSESGELAHSRSAPPSGMSATPGWSVPGRPAPPQSPAFQSVPHSGYHYPTQSAPYPPNYGVQGQGQGFYPAPSPGGQGSASFPAYPSTGSYPESSYPNEQNR